MRLESLVLDIKKIVDGKIDKTRSMDNEEIISLIEAEVFNLANHTFISASQKK